MLRRPEALQRNVLWRQRVTAFWGEDEQQRGFDAAIQREGDALTVLGLSPTGSMGFAIVLRGETVELTNRLPEQIPFPPRYVLLDVQRAFYPWLPESPQSAGDGDRQGTVDGESVVETWRDGRLQTREFTRLDGVPAGTLRITYTWDRPDWTVPSLTRLENDWFGYRLEIETHEETMLAASSALAEPAGANLP